MDLIPEILNNATTIVCALISFIVTLSVCQINAKSQHDKTLSSLSASYDMLSYKIEELSKRVDKHNHLVERMYHLEQSMEIQMEKLNVANHRISDLEKET